MNGWALAAAGVVATIATIAVFDIGTNSDGNTMGWLFDMPTTTPVLTFGPVPSPTPEPSEANNPPEQNAPEAPVESVVRQDEETVIPVPLPIDTTAPTVAVTVPPLPTLIPTPPEVTAPVPFPICLIHGNGRGKHLGERKKC